MADKTQDKGRRDDASQSGGRPEKSNRGFAGMDPRRQREIASEGGRAAHQQGRAPEVTSEEAREAGRKGGMASGGSRRRAAANRAAARGNQTPQSQIHQAGGSHEDESRGTEEEAKLAERQEEDRNI
jgi:general stress protein YciG